MTGYINGVIPDAQIADMLMANGWSKDQAPTALAVILAESGGKPNAESTLSTATGLFQILSGVWLKDSDVAKLAHSRDDLKNPITNIKVGAIVLRKQGWTAWTTYTSGSYKRFLDRATKAVGGSTATGDNPVRDGLGKVASIPGSIASATGLDGLTAKIGTIADNGGVIILAVVLLMAGVFILVRQNGSVKKAASILPVVGALV